MWSDDMTAWGRANAAFEMLSRVLVIVAASGLVWTLFFKRPTEPPPPLPPVTDVNETIAAKHLTNVEGSGPIAIVEFADFQCPFCARHATNTLPTMKKELLDSGKARYVAMNLPLDMHPHALPAAEAAECAANQGAYWRMHELLFAKQKDLATTNYVALAGELGLNLREFEACLDSDNALKRVKAHINEAQRLGVRSTPIFFLGRVRDDGSVDLLKRINGARPFGTFSTELAKMTRF
jgi:protein-disulfide isomerase